MTMKRFRPGVLAAVTAAAALAAGITATAALFTVRLVRHVAVT